MNIRLWLATGIRLFSVFLVTEAAVSLFSSITTARSLGLENLGVYVVIALYLVIAAILWFFPMTITNKIVPSVTSETTKNITPFEFARIGCGLLSLYIIMNNIWSVTLAFYFMKQGYNDSPDVLANLYTGLLMVMSGLVLFFNNRKVAYLMCK